MMLETEEDIGLRRISSLDGSECFSSIDEKRAAIGNKRQGLSARDIPEYPKTPPYKTSPLKRIYARARYFWAIIRQKLSGREYPLIVVLVVNNKCNWDCSYCYGDYPNRIEVDYTTNEIKHLIDRLYGMGVRYINMHGGEALLRNDIGELCSFAKHKGMYVSLVTNGSLLDRKMEEVRIVDSLTISLDGALPGNDANRGGGSFDKTIVAIRSAVREKIPLRVQATLTRQSMHDVGFMAKLAQEENFHLQFSILFKPMKKARDSQMSNDEIRSVIRDIQKYKKLGYPIFTSDSALESAYHWPFDYNSAHHADEERIPDSYRAYHVRCFYSRTKFTIEADGYVYPCFLTTDGSFSPKSWKEVGVEEAIGHVQRANTCRACPAMTQNDHNLLLGFDWKQVGYIIKDQLEETLQVRNKVREEG